ncbi:MAG TPA: hypothetical protein VNJ28_01870, partial [Candidatus Limnocylindrales bacterium]|nr:hypothetical protein [Candidatus Limnocylindrales bacterium]
MAKVRQSVAHVGARVAGPADEAALAPWTTPAERAVFASMHPADRRHGLEVVERLRASGVTDRAVLVAGLLHDAGKERAGLVARVVHALGERYGPWVWRLAATLPGLGAELGRLRAHPELSARLAAAAGCPARTVELIRHQADPVDEAGRLLLAADEATGR